MRQHWFVLVMSSSLLLRVLRLLPSSRQHQSSKIAHFWDRVANCALFFAHVLLHQCASWVLFLLLLNLNTEHFETPKAPRTATHIRKDKKIEQNMAKRESDLITNTSITMMPVRLSRGVHVTRCFCGSLKKIPINKYIYIYILYIRVPDIYKCIYISKKKNRTPSQPSSRRAHSCNALSDTSCSPLLLSSLFSASGDFS